MGFRENLIVEDIGKRKIRENKEKPEEHMIRENKEKPARNTIQQKDVGRDDR